MPENYSNIINHFFRSIELRGKYNINIKNNVAYIIPRDEEKYYKPVIKITNLEEFTNLLIKYIEAINNFNTVNNVKLKPCHDLSYFLNIFLLNLTASDANDLNSFLKTRISFFRDNNFDDFVTQRKIFDYDSATFYAKREVGSLGLETPYIMGFSMYSNGKYHNLPIVRYAINSDKVCYIYAIQTGRCRNCDTNNSEYKSIINQVNQGVKKYRNISPSFVLILAIFLKILKDNGINRIVIPDYLFNRYRKYYKGNSEIKSNEIISRMFHNITALINRTESEITGFDIKSYPLDIDSYYHIEVNSLDSENKILRKIFN